MREFFKNKFIIWYFVWVNYWDIEKIQTFKCFSYDKLTFGYELLNKNININKQDILLLSF